MIEIAGTDDEKQMYVEVQKFEDALHVYTQCTAIENFVYSNEIGVSSSSNALRFQPQSAVTNSNKSIK